MATGKSSLGGVATMAGPSRDMKHPVNVAGAGTSLRSLLAHEVKEHPAEMSQAQTRLPNDMASDGKHPTNSESVVEVSDSDEELLPHVDVSRKPEVRYK